MGREQLSTRFVHFVKVINQLRHAANFRLIASDIPWDEQALMEQFRLGICSDVKDLLLTFPEDPRSLTEAISRAIRCDNRLFERRCE